MVKTYYHVVTDKPVKVGQIIIFDEIHHSGVYNRVYELKDKVDNIYLHPDNYNENEFDHHLKVALRELALEEVRKNKYPNYPSRLSSLYVSDSLEEAENWYNYFIELGRPTYSIVKVETDGKEFIGNASKCFDGTKDKNKNLKLAEYYWKTNNKDEKMVKEILINGKIKVIEIIKENKLLIS